MDVKLYNFAAIADLDEALQKPVETARINVLGNVQVLEACLKFGISRYVYASTVYVYSHDGDFTAVVNRQRNTMSRNTNVVMDWTMPYCDMKRFMATFRSQEWSLAYCQECIGDWFGQL